MSTLARSRSRTCLEELGEDPDETLAHADSPQIRSCFEIFWGDDRLEHAIEWAKTHTDEASSTL